MKLLIKIFPALLLSITLIFLVRVNTAIAAIETVIGKSPQAGCLQEVPGQYIIYTNPNNHSLGGVASYCFPDAHDSGRCITGGYPGADVKCTKTPCGQDCDDCTRVGRIACNQSTAGCFWQARSATRDYECTYGRYSKGEACNDNPAETNPFNRAYCYNTESCNQTTKMCGPKQEVTATPDPGQAGKGPSGDQPIVVREASPTIPPRPTATPTPTPLPPTKPGWCADDLRGNEKAVLSATCNINNSPYNGTYDAYCKATYGSPSDTFYECPSAGTPLVPGYCANASRTSNPVTINSATCGINNTVSDSTYDKWCVDNYGVNDSQSNYFYKCSSTPTPSPSATVTPSLSTTISPTPVTPGLGCATPNPNAVKTGYECPSTGYGGCMGGFSCQSDSNSKTGCMCKGSGPTATPKTPTATPIVADTCTNHNGVCGDSSYPNTHPGAVSWGPLAPCQSSYCWVGEKNCADRGGVCGDSSYPDTHPGKVSWGQIHPCTGADYCWANP